VSLLSEKEGERPLEISQSRGPLATTWVRRVLIVGVAQSDVETVLGSGVGPGLPPGVCCPDCGGVLGCWGSYPRWVRWAGEITLLRVRRALCGACGRTHALLPSFLYARRLDGSETIFGALVMAAQGAGHRRVCVAVGVPASTARGWLRRARLIALQRSSRFVVLAQALGAPVARPPPPSDEPLVGLLGAVAHAHRAAVERFGALAVSSAGAFSCAVCGGWLLANTSWPFPGSVSTVRVGLSVQIDREGDATGE
jgi:hypothetical protein